MRFLRLCVFLTMKKHQTMRWRTFFISSMLIFVVTGCLPDDDNDDIAQWIGEWSVKETSGEFAPQTYTVTISRRPSVMGDRVNIRGLYAQGYDFLLVADAFGNGLEINEQEVESLSISGTLRINNAGDRASLNMTVNDGSGNDQVAGELTK